MKCNLSSLERVWRWNMRTDRQIHNTSPLCIHFIHFMQIVVIEMFICPGSRQQLPAYDNCVSNFGSFTKQEARAAFQCRLDEASTSRLGVWDSIPIAVGPLHIWEMPDFFRLHIYGTSFREIIEIAPGLLMIFRNDEKFRILWWMLLSNFDNVCI